MLIYTLIQSPGYYIDRGNRPMLVMFAGVWVLTLIAVAVRFGR